VRIVSAIVRHAIPARHLSAGDVVTAPESVFGLPYGTFCDAGGEVFQAATDLFFPMARYLRPPRLWFNFTALAVLDRWTRKLPDFFVADPENMETGLFPYRFDSPGEALYFLRQRQLMTDRFLLVNFGEIHDERKNGYRREG
jgi:hypothetical protein